MVVRYMELIKKFEPITPREQENVKDSPSRTDNLNITPVNRDRVNREIKLNESNPPSTGSMHEPPIPSEPESCNDDNKGTDPMIFEPREGQAEGTQSTDTNASGTTTDQSTSIYRIIMRGIPDNIPPLPIMNQDEVEKYRVGLQQFLRFTANELDRLNKLSKSTEDSDMNRPVLPDTSELEAQTPAGDDQQDPG